MEYHTSQPKKHITSIIVCTCIIIVLAACTQAGLSILNAHTSTKNYTVTTKAYGSLPLQNLDIYTPTISQKTANIIVFLHGGRWTYGKKEDYRFVAARLTKAGFTVVIPNYRKYPSVRFPTFVEDSAKAIAWTHNNLAKPNTAKLSIIGHSAGAHIGSLIIADKKYLSNENLTPSIIYRFVGLAGPYSFTPEEKDLKDMFGPESQYPKMQTTTFITGSEPPMLLLYGLADKDVRAYNHEKLANRIKEKHGEVKVITYPNIDHIDIITAFSWLHPDSDIVDDTIKFLKN